MVVSCTSTNQPAGSDEAVSGTVTTVFDGDSFEMQTTEGAVVEVRMIGINAPERDECFAAESLANLAPRLENDTVSVEIAGTDQFDRLLGNVFVDDTNINVEVVSQGLAIATSVSEDDPHADAKLTAEDEAAGNARGLWDPSACGSMPPLPAISLDPDRSMPNPPGPDDEALSTETIVIVNEDSAPIELSGWVLRDESSRHRFTFQPGARLEIGGTLTVSSADAGWDPGDSPVWNNDGDMALLLDPNGTVVARWRY